MARLRHCGMRGRWPGSGARPSGLGRVTFFVAKESQRATPPIRPNRPRTFQVRNGSDRTAWVAHPVPDCVSRHLLMALLTCPFPRRIGDQDQAQFHWIRKQFLFAYIHGALV